MKQLRRLFAVLLALCILATTLATTAFAADSDMSSIAKKLTKNATIGTTDGIEEMYQTLQATRQLDKNVYLMDYQYDYDIDDLIAQGGCDSILSLLAYCSKHLVGGAYNFQSGKVEMGCTTFNAFTKSGDQLLARNFDYKDSPCFVVWTHNEDAYASISMVDSNLMLIGDINHPETPINQVQTLLAPYIPVDGMNEKGLAISVLQIHADPTDQDTGKDDMFFTTLIRTCLDKAATVDEAIKIFKSYDVHDAMGVCYHYQICDATGKSVLIEYSDNKMNLIYPGDEEYDQWMSDYKGTNPVQFVANFYLTEDADHSGDDGYNDTDPCGDRASVLSKALKKTKGTMTELQAIDLLEKVSANYKHETYPWYITSLWSDVYNTKKGTMTMAARLNYDTVYQFRVTKPLKAAKVRDR